MSKDLVRLAKDITQRCRARVPDLCEVADQAGSRVRQMLIDILQEPVLAAQVAHPATPFPPYAKELARVVDRHGRRAPLTCSLVLDMIRDPGVAADCRAAR